MNDNFFFDIIMEVKIKTFLLSFFVLLFSPKIGIHIHVVRPIGKKGKFNKYFH